MRAAAASFQPQVIQVLFAEMAQYVGAIAGVRAPCVLIDQDPGVRAAADYSHSATGLRRWSRHIDTIAWERYSRRVFSDFDRIVVLTDSDRESVEPLAGGVGIETIPLAVELPRTALDPLGARPPTVLFFGDYLHPPNADAALCLIRTIMPRVRKAHPTAVLELVGPNPTTEIASCAGSGVEIRGVVPSLTPYLERAALIAAPIRLGGGMRTKVLETLAFGKALVATPRAIEGLDLVPGRDVVVAESDEDFCTEISDLIADDERRARLGGNARAWVEANLGWEPVVSAYDGLYRELLAADE